MLNEDGTIHIAPIFFKYQDGRIVMATQDASRKIRNIKGNNNVTVLHHGRLRVLRPLYEVAGNLRPKGLSHYGVR